MSQGLVGTRAEVNGDKNLSEIVHTASNPALISTLLV
jgi:hypothetical protein